MKYLILLTLITSCGVESMMVSHLEYQTETRGKELLAVCLEDLDNNEENKTCTYIEEEEI